MPPADEVKLPDCDRAISETLAALNMIIKRRNKDQAALNDLAASLERIANAIRKGDYTKRHTIGKASGV